MWERRDLGFGDWDAQARSKPLLKKLPSATVTRAETGDEADEEKEEERMEERAERREAMRVGLRRCCWSEEESSPVRVRMNMSPRFSTVHMTAMTVGWFGVG